MASRRVRLLIAVLVGIQAVRVVKRSDRSTNSLLVPIETRQPDTMLYPPRRHPAFEPANTVVQGPKQTNKFWGNWIIDDNNDGFSIYPSPYTLRFRAEGSSPSGSMYVMKGETDYQGTFFTTHWLPDFVMGAVEGFEGMHSVVQEQHFGIHARVQGTSCTVDYPVFAGMAYPSAKYSGSCTPRITSDYGLVTVQQVSAGIFKFQSHRKEYRVYVLTTEGEFVDSSYTFNAQGTLNKQLNGWVRLADLQQASDATVLDQYARKILVGWELEVEDGVVRYNFETVGPSSVSLLHWVYANHMHFLSSGASQANSLTRTRSPVKGLMYPLVGGNTWTFSVDLTEALALGFLPAQEPRAEHVATIVTEIERDYQFFTQYWRTQLHKRGWYYSGKGFQKLATLCQMMKKFRGASDSDVQNCAALLKEGFRCMYDRNVADVSDPISDRRPFEEWDYNYENVGCWWSPFGVWYDESWGGIANRWVNKPEDIQICGEDFGNYCYNDHHYHWGYFVVAGAMLLDLMPAMAQETRFVHFINMFLRDAANPSSADTYFPQFRAFDWFDMHSWSRGLKPDPSGKDQESTSEEVNLHYGMLMWGKAIGNDQIAKLGATMLTVASTALQEYFLLKRDNANHPASFSKYHVTGIFFQNKVELTTWFGPNPMYIHGIQMLPLTAGLQLSRKDDFAFEEWTDSLVDIPINLTEHWWSILFTGNLAMWNPDQAWSYLVQMAPENMNDGLTKSWALYWTSVQKADGPRPTPSPTPPPAPTAAPSPGAPSPPSGVFCDPNSAIPQMCPGGIPCPQCGAGACECPR